MKSKISRRELAGLAIAATAATAQTPAPPPVTPATAAEDLAAFRAQIKRNFEQLAKINLPMSTEPAVHFRA